MEDRDGINIWLAYSDLFAGMLIVFAVFYGLQLERERALNKDLLKAQNFAVEMLSRVAKNINENESDPSKYVKTDGTQLILPADITFKSGDYTIKEDSKAWLLEIGNRLQQELDKLADKHGVTIEIRGHTDARPLGGGGIMPTNWELSSRRATEIVRFYQSKKLLDPTRFRVVAVGAAEFEEYEKNFTGKTLKGSDELEPLRKIQIRIVPNYEDLLKSIAVNSKPAASSANTSQK